MADYFRYVVIVNKTTINNNNTDTTPKNYNWSSLLKRLSVDSTRSNSPEHKSEKQSLSAIVIGAGRADSQTSISSGSGLATTSTSSPVDSINELSPSPLHDSPTLTPVTDVDVETPQIKPSPIVTVAAPSPEAVARAIRDLTANVSPTLAESDRQFENSLRPISPDEFVQRRRSPATAESFEVTPPASPMDTRGSGSLLLSERAISDDDRSAQPSPVVPEGYNVTPRSSNPELLVQRADSITDTTIGFTTVTSTPTTVVIERRASEVSQSSTPPVSARMLARGGLLDDRRPSALSTTSTVGSGFWEESDTDTPSTIREALRSFNDRQARASTHLAQMIDTRLNTVERKLMTATTQNHEQSVAAVMSLRESVTLAIQSIHSEMSLLQSSFRSFSTSSQETATNDRNAVEKQIRELNSAVCCNLCIVSLIDCLDL